MHWIDIIILIPLLWGVYKGLSRGFIMEVISLFSLILAVYLAMKLSDWLATSLSERLEQDSLFMPALAFAIIFLLVLLGGLLTGKILSLIVKTVALGPVNKIAGAIFGVLKMGLLVSLLLFMVHVADEKFRLIPEQTKDASLLYQPFTSFAIKAVPAVKDSPVFAGYRQTL